PRLCERVPPAAGGAGAPDEADAHAHIRPRRLDRHGHAHHRAADRGGAGGGGVSVATEQQEVLDEIRAADKLFLTTHENPDGDALGSLRAMQLILEQLGKDSVMFMARDEFPLPREYRHMPFDDVLLEPPADLKDRLVVFLDCGNMDRMPVEFLRSSDARIVNIDHH